MCQEGLTKCEDSVRSVGEQCVKSMRAVSHEIEERGASERSFTACRVKRQSVRAALRIRGTGSTWRVLKICGSLHRHVQGTTSM